MAAIFSHFSNITRYIKPPILMVDDTSQVKVRKRERKKKRWWRFLLLNTAEWGHPNQSDFPRWWRCWAAASAAPAAAADDAAPYPSVCLRIWLRWGTSSPEEEKKETEERETDPNWVVARNRTADKMHSNGFSNNLKSPFFFVRQTGPTGRWRL